MTGKAIWEERSVLLKNSEKAEKSLKETLDKLDAVARSKLTDINVFEVHRIYETWLNKVKEAQALCLRYTKELQEFDQQEFTKV